MLQSATNRLKAKRDTTKKCQRVSGFLDILLDCIVTETIKIAYKRLSILFAGSSEIPYFSSQGEVFVHPDVQPASGIERAHICSLHGWKAVEKQSRIRAYILLDLG